MAIAEDDTDEEDDKEPFTSLDGLLNPAVWNTEPERIEEIYEGIGFAWLSETKKDEGILRGNWRWRLPEKTSDEKSEDDKKKPRRFYNPEFFEGKLGVEEVNFRFLDGTLNAVTVSIWNKGDSPYIERERFEQLLEDITTELDSAMGVRGEDMGLDRRSASRAHRTRWEGDGIMAQLEYSTSRHAEHGVLGEFIRLRLVPGGGRRVGAVGPGNVAKVSQRELIKNVKKEESGDVWVTGIPMVDQGQKGYCAVASAERVLRYYGVRCDQHDLAQAAETTGGGTYPHLMQDALHSIQPLFKVKVRDLIHWDIKDYEKFTDTYNRAAKKLGGRPTPEGREWVSFRGLDKNSLRAARCRNGAYEDFAESVESNIKKGIPLLWALELGIFPENGEPARQDGGGHMRLIHGYNKKTDEVIFSDSWGAGHEFKRMKGQDAFTVTKGLYIIEPKKR